MAGAAADGRPYHARDPQLLLWVQTTLVLTSLRWYELVAGPLAPEDRQRYWDEGKVFARALGVPDELFPRTIGDLERYEREMLETAVRPDTTSRLVASTVLRPLGFLPAAVYWPTDTIASGLLPTGIRAAFGLRWGLGERLLFRFVVHALRALRTVTPQRLAIVPHARLYDERMRD